MSAKSRVCVMAGIVAGALLLAGGCHATPAPKQTPDRPVVAKIVGEWTSDQFQTQVGKATQTFCLRADGTAAVHTDVETGPLSDTGTYVLDATRLTVRLSKAPAPLVLQVSWAGERLVLTDESSEPRSYRRTSGGC